MSILDRLFRGKQTPPPYDKEILSRTKGITNALYNLFNPQLKNHGIIVTSKEQASSLDELLQLAPNTQSEPSQIINRYLYLQSLGASYGYSDHIRERLSTILFIWRDGSYAHNSHILFRDSTIHDHTDNETVVQTMSDILKDPLYTALKELEALRNYASNVTRNSEKERSIQKLSLQQDLVDYIIKLELIGNDPDVFDALTRRPPEWQSAFFKPLFAINTYLTSIDSIKEQRTVHSADNQLESIVQWSSNSFEPIKHLNKPKKD